MERERDKDDLMCNARVDALQLRTVPNKQGAQLPHHFGSFGTSRMISTEPLQTHPLCLALKPVGLGVCFNLFYRISPQQDSGDVPLWSEAFSLVAGPGTGEFVSHESQAPHRLDSACRYALVVWEPAACYFVSCSSWLSVLWLP